MGDANFRLGTRAARRVEVKAPIQARWGENRYIVEIEDLYTSGARMRTSRSLPKGAVIWLRLPGLEALQAEVMWTHSFTFGCRFIQPLHESVFANL
jgi:hypothetical protein